MKQSTQSKNLFFNIAIARFGAGYECAAAGGVSVANET